MSGATLIGLPSFDVNDGQPPWSNILVAGVEIHTSSTILIDDIGREPFDGTSILIILFITS